MKGCSFHVYFVKVPILNVSRNMQGLSWTPSPRCSLEVLGYFRFSKRSHLSNHRWPHVHTAKHHWMGGGVVMAFDFIVRVLGPNHHIHRMVSVLRRPLDGEVACH